MADRVATGPIRGFELMGVRIDGVSGLGGSGTRANESERARERESERAREGESGID